jgi:hypothetical protein
LRSLALALVTLAVLALATDAAATTYCVAKPSCVTKGGTSEPDVQSALDAADANPGPDQVEIGPGTFDSGPAGYVADSDNDVFVLGSFEPTVLENDGGTVFKLGSRNSSLVNVTLTFRTSNTSALDLSGHAFTVRINGETGRSSTSVGYGVLLRGGAVFDASAVTLPIGESMTPTVGVESTGPGTRWVGSSSVTADTAFDNSVGAGTTHIAYSRTRSPVGVAAVTGTTIVANSIIESVGGSYRAGIDLAPSRTSGVSEATLNASNLTIVGSGSGTGVRVAAGAWIEQHAVLNINSSIVTGFANSLGRVGAGPGHEADLDVSYSDFDPNAVASSGAGDFTNGPGNIFAPPRFVDRAGGDYHLRSSSRTIDAGKPGAFGASAAFDGQARRLSGHGACVRRRDMGAFEYLPPPRRPRAVARVRHSRVPLGSRARFNARGSCDPDYADSIVSYRWRFDDGKNAHGFHVRHRFKTRGTHHATLTVRDTTGRTDTATATVTITAA